MDFYIKDVVYLSLNIEEEDYDDVMYSGGK